MEAGSIDNLFRNFAYKEQGAAGAGCVVRGEVHPFLSLFLPLYYSPSLLSYCLSFFLLEQLKYI